MRIQLTVMLQDRPGQLLRVLEVLAEEDVNIVSIIHERERMTEVIPVNLVVEVPQNLQTSLIRKKFEDMGIMLVKLEEVVEKARVSFIISTEKAIPYISMVGEGVEVVSFEGEVGPRGGSAVRVTLQGPLEELRKSLKKVEDFVRREGGLIIFPIEVAFR